MISFWKLTWALVLANIMSIVIVYGTIGLLMLATVGMVGFKPLH